MILQREKSGQKYINTENISPTFHVNITPGLIKQEIVSIIKEKIVCKEVKWCRKYRAKHWR